jgi:hypothetical protein
MIGGAITMPTNAQLAPAPMERTVDEEHEVDEDIDSDRDETVRYRVS